MRDPIKLHAAYSRGERYSEVRNKVEGEADWCADAARLYSSENPKRRDGGRARKCKGQSCCHTLLAHKNSTILDLVRANNASHSKMLDLFN